MAHRQLLLGHTKLESIVRYLGIEVDDALSISEQVELVAAGAAWHPILRRRADRRQSRPRTKVCFGASFPFPLAPAEVG